LQEVKRRQKQERDCNDKWKEERKKHWLSRPNLLSWKTDHTFILCNQTGKLPDFAETNLKQISYFKDFLNYAH